MTLYAQHGYGCGDRLTTAARGRYIDGAIFAAGSVELDNLRSCIDELRSARRSTAVLVDPQFFLCAISEVNDKYLMMPGHDYYRPARRIREFVGPAALTRHAQATIDFQRQFSVSRLISPTVLFESFDDRWYDIALNLARASVEYHATLSGAPPLLICFMFREEALTQRRPMEQFLDELTSDGLPGCYLVPVRSDDTKWPRCDPLILGRIAYLVHVLGAVNGREVVCGYADWGGLLMRAAGAAAFGSGWSQKYRTFRTSSFGSSTGPRRSPAKRYSSGRLLNQLRLEEARTCVRAGLRATVLSGVGLDSELLGNNWDNRTMHLHHWQTLYHLNGQLTDDVAGNLEVVEGWLDQASIAYNAIREESINLEPDSRGRHLPEWREAIEELRRLAEL